MAPSRHNRNLSMEKLNLSLEYCKKESYLDVESVVTIDDTTTTKIWRPYDNHDDNYRTPTTFNPTVVSSATSTNTKRLNLPPEIACRFRPIISTNTFSEVYDSNTSDRSSERSISPEIPSFNHCYFRTSSSSADLRCSPCSLTSSEDSKSSSLRHFENSYTGTSSRNHPYSSERQKRSKFTKEQLKTLNKTFYERTYLTLQERHSLSTKLDLSEEQVKNWFQNKRMKTKRDYIHAVDKGLIIPLENPGLPKFSRMPVNYFMSVPVSPVKYMMNSREFSG